MKARPPGDRAEPAGLWPLGGGARCIFAWHVGDRHTRFDAYAVVRRGQGVVQLLELGGGSEVEGGEERAGMWLAMAMLRDWSSEPIQVGVR